MHLAWMCDRSEEHTSELQSQSNLVCRLLLEKKKTTLSRRVSRPWLRWCWTPGRCLEPWGLGGSGTSEDRLGASGLAPLREAVTSHHGQQAVPARPRHAAAAARPSPLPAPAPTAPRRRAAARGATGPPAAGQRAQARVRLAGAPPHALLFFF